MYLYQKSICGLSKIQTELGIQCFIRCIWPSVSAYPHPPLLMLSFPHHAPATQTFFLFLAAQPHFYLRTFALDIPLPNYWMASSLLSPRSQLCHCLREASVMPKGHWYPPTHTHTHTYSTSLHHVFLFYFAMMLTKIILCIYRLNLLFRSSLRHQLQKGLKEQEPCVLCLL